MPEQTITKERGSPIPGFDAEAAPLLGLGLGLTGLALGLRPRLAPLPLALTAIAAALYRDPSRHTPADAGALFAPADGAVIAVDEVYEHRFMHTDCLRIAVASSPLDVPVGRCPSAGVVRYLEHVSGEYRPIGDKAAPERNERLYIGVETDWGPMMVVQIAGPLGRRIACKVQAGERLAAGARLGTVRFGARTDLIVQRDSVHLLVGAGQHVTAGVSRVGDVKTL